MLEKTENQYKLLDVGYDAGLRNLDLDIFAEFFEQRFGEGNLGYAAEWASRLTQGTAWCYADFQTRKALVAAEARVRNRYGGVYEAKYVPEGELTEQEKAR